MTVAPNLLESKHRFWRVIGRMSHCLTTKILATRDFNNLASQENGFLFSSKFMMKLNFFSFAKLVASITIFANCFPLLAAADEPKSRPNFLFFMTDDLNKEYYDCYGGQLGATPAVSALAKEGMVFENAFTGQAICAPSRSMLYTGKYPLRNGAFKNHSAVYNDTRSVCHYLRDLDYDVILCGKSHVKPDRAFPWTISMHNEKPAGSPEHYTRPALPADQLENYFANTRDRSFCVMANSYYPHGEHPNKTKFSPDSIPLTRFKENNSLNRKSEASFAQAIKNGDDEFAGVLKLLKKYDLENNTVVFYASDHGRFGKFTLYDRGLNVPFVIRWPGVVKPGTRTDALVSFADVLPTMLEIAGSKRVDDFDGKSFAPLLKGETNSHRDYVHGVMTNQGIIHAHVFPGRMIRSNQYKYICNYNAMEVVDRKKNLSDAMAQFLRMGAQRHPGVPEEELFDVIADPNEESNLASNPSFQEIKKKLRNDLQEWLVSQNDFLKDEGNMPLLATPKQFRLDVLSHPKNKVNLPAELRNSLENHPFYEHEN